METEKQGQNEKANSMSQKDCVRICAEIQSMEYGKA